MNPRHSTCPYREVATNARWRDAVGQHDDATLDPHAGEQAPFRIDASTRIATAGSCFAQHIGTALRRKGFHHEIAERGPPFLDDAARHALGYGLFSARYGNIYTTAQLAQLLDRAWGRFDPEEPIWEHEGRFFDPLRPGVQSGGHASRAELLADREAHLAAVRSLFETLDVLVFTLGLTEAWVSRVDGAVFPVCPGCGCGTHDPQRHAFRNFTYPQVRASLEHAIAAMRAVNPRVKIILTVSPVPLVATMSGRHVLQATTYSKSVLRAVAGDVSACEPEVAYFASYEIVTACRDAHGAFEDDRRSVRPARVQRVMESFFRHFAGHVPDDVQAAPGRTEPAPHCDEEALAMALGHARAGEGGERA